jgi:hypothetical protein
MFTVDIVLNTFKVSLYSADYKTMYGLPIIAPFLPPTMTHPAFALWANNTADVQGVSFTLENPQSVIPYFPYAYPGSTVVLIP